MPTSPSTEKLNNILTTKVDPSSPRFQKNARALADLVTTISREQDKVREGGGAKAIEGQHGKSRLTARERVALLIDKDSPFTELDQAGAGNDNLYYTGTPGARYNPAVGLGIPDLTALAGVLG